MITSERDPDQPSIRLPAAPSNAELEQLRQHSIQVLGSVAAALKAAGHQKQILLAEVQAAQQTLQGLANECESAEASLSVSRAQLSQAATRLEALAAEIVVLERQRDETMVVGGISDVTTAAVPPRIAATAVRPPRWPETIRTLAADLDQFVLAHPVHPGFGNVTTALFMALLLAMALLLSPLTQVFGGLQLLAVTSGSMAPGIPTGSVVGVRPVPASDLKVGDVITFANSSSPDVLVTHRIVSLDVRNGQTMLTTKGDANDAVDALTAPASRAVGRVEFAMPWLGDAMIWLGSPTAKTVGVGLAVLAVALSVASVRRSPGTSLVAH